LLQLQVKKSTQLLAHILGLRLLELLAFLFFALELVPTAQAVAPKNTHRAALVEAVAV
jgi:hypothetical protein